MANIKNEIVDDKLETSKLYIEIKKMQPIIEDLRKKNVSRFNSSLGRP